MEAAEQILVNCGFFLVTRSAITPPSVELLSSFWNISPIIPPKSMKLLLSFGSPFLISSLVVRRSCPKTDAAPLSIWHGITGEGCCNISIPEQRED